MLLTEYDLNLQVPQKLIKNWYAYRINSCTLTLMLSDISINCSCVINVTNLYVLFLPKLNIYLIKKTFCYTHNWQISFIIMRLNLTNTNAGVCPHTIRNCNDASVHSASFLRKLSCSFHPTEHSTDLTQYLANQDPDPVRGGVWKLGKRHWRMNVLYKNCRDLFTVFMQNLAIETKYLFQGGISGWSW